MPIELPLQPHSTIRENHCTILNEKNAEHGKEIALSANCRNNFSTRTPELFSFPWNQDNWCSRRIFTCPSILEGPFVKQRKIFRDNRQKQDETLQHQISHLESLDMSGTVTSRMLTTLQLQSGEALVLPTQSSFRPHKSSSKGSIQMLLIPTTEPQTKPVLYYHHW